MGLLILRRRPISSARLLAAALLLSLSSVPGVAHAQSDADRQKARELGDEGKAALARKDFAAAREMFQKASSLVAAPTLEIGLARAEAGLGHLVAARERYAHVARLTLDPGAPPAFAKALKEAEAELIDIDLRMPKVVLTVDGAPAAQRTQVTIDGREVPAKEIGEKRAVDPGRHTARAAAPTFQPAEASFTASEGGVSEVRLTLAPAPSAGMHPPTMVSFGLLGLGAGALAVGGVLGGFALRDRGALETSCTDGACTEAQRGKLEAYHRESLLAWPALATGAAAVGAGATLLLLSRPKGAILPGKIAPALLGAGVGGLAFGAVTGVVALNANPASAKDAPPCAPSACLDRTTGAREVGVVAIASLAAGGAAAVSGVVLLALKKNDPAPASSAALITPEIGPGMIGLSGRF